MSGIRKGIRCPSPFSKVSLSTTMIVSIAALQKFFLSLQVVMTGKAWTVRIVCDILVLSVMSDISCNFSVHRFKTVTTQTPSSPPARAHAQPEPPAVKVQIEYIHLMYYLFSLLYVRVWPQFSILYFHVLRSLLETCNCLCVHTCIARANTNSSLYFLPFVRQRQNLS